MKTETDQNLASKAASGDSGSFAELYTRHHGRVLAEAEQLAGPEAEDIASETWLRAWDGIRGYREQGTDFASWLRKLVRQAAEEHLLEVAAQPELGVTGEEYRPELWDADPAAAATDRATVGAVVARLSTAQRSCLHLQFWHDLPTEHVAQALGCSPRAAVNLYRRAIHTLRTVTRGGVAHAYRHR